MSWVLGGVTLPASATVASGFGVTLQRNLTRAVDSGAWVVYGDGLAVPSPLSIEITVQADNATAAMAEALAYWGIAQGATSLSGPAYSRGLQGAQGYTLEQLDCSTVKITIQLLPTGG